MRYRSFAVVQPNIVHFWLIFEVAASRLTLTITCVLHTLASRELSQIHEDSRHSTLGGLVRAADGAGRTDTPCASNAITSLSILHPLTCCFPASSIARTTALAVADLNHGSRRAHSRLHHGKGCTTDRSYHSSGGVRPQPIPLIIRSLIDNHFIRHRYDQLAEHYRTLFGHSPTYIARAPGRVNIIGEHIDYALFGVCPMAVEQDVLIACAPRPASETTDGHGHVNAKNVHPKYTPQSFAPMLKTSYVPVQFVSSLLT